MTYTSITSEISALNYPYTVKHKTHGIGQLVYVTAPANGNSLYATIDFESGSSKVFALKTLIDFNLLEKLHVQKCARQEKLHVRFLKK